MLAFLELVHFMPNAEVNGTQPGALDREKMAKPCASRREVLSVRVRSKATNGLTALLADRLNGLQELIDAPWAPDYDWLHWRAFARTLEADDVSLAHDGEGHFLAAPSRNPLITRFRAYADSDYTAFVTALRVPGMATRTEQTYEHWLARFCAFH